MKNWFSDASNRIKPFQIFQFEIPSLICLFFLLVSTSFAADTLIVRYPFNESSGTVIHDSSGSGKDGTAMKAPSFVNSFNGNAIYLNGTDSQYVQLPAGIINSCNDITICMWVRMTAESTWMRFFDFGNGTNSGYMFLAVLGDSLRFAITNSGGTSEQQFNAPVISTNIWKHIAVRLKSPDTAQIYLDGALKASKTGISIRPSSLGSTANNFIGKSQYNDPFMNGAIKDFRIYKNALTQTSIANLYNSTKPVNFTWDSAVDSGYQPATSGTWGTNNYWSPDGYALMQWPSSGGRAIFGGTDSTYKITVTGTQNVDSISFLTSGYTLSGGTVNMGKMNGIYVGSGKNVTINSVISGSGGLIMNAGSSSSILTLGGANTYSGGTNVKTGKLILNGSLSSSSAVTIGSGATLAGTGTAAGSVTIQKGGILQPGDSNAVKFSTGSLALDSTSVLNWNIGTKCDTVAVTGDLTLNGKLNISAGSGYGTGTYTIMTYSGTFTNKGLSVSAVPNGYAAKIDTSGGSVRLTLFANSNTQFTVNLSKDTSVTVEGSSLTLAVKAVTSPINIVYYNWHILGTTDSVVKIDTISLDTSKADTIKFNNIKSATLNGKKIYCVAKGLIDSAISKTTVIKVIPAANNPVRVTGSLIDVTHVKLTITNFSSLPAQSGTSPYVDAVGIWYNIDSYPSKLDTTSTNLIKIPLNYLLSKGNSFDTIVTISRGVMDCQNYYFAGSVFWKNPDLIPSIITTNGTSVYMCDTTSKLANPLSLTGTYIKPDTVLLTIDSLSRIKKDSILYMIVSYGNVNDTIQSKNLPDPPVTKYLKKYTDQMFAGAQSDVIFKLVIRGIRGNYSNQVSDTVTVGKPRPINNCVLKVDSSFATQIKLKWNSLASDKLDSIRICYDTSKIPIGSEIDKSKYHFIALSGNDTTTVISGLTQLTTYYFGLQVLKDSLWSYNTDSSSISRQTSKISDLSSIPNKLKILELAFDSTKNQLRFIWKIDTTGLEIDAGVTWGLGGFPATNPDSMNSKQIITIKTGDLSKPDTNYIDLTNFTYDSLYYFSIWLRKANGIWAPPIDSSKDTTRIPEPKWQAVTYFTDKTDSISVFAKKVLISKGSSWTGLVNDTINVFKPDATPGFIPVSMGIVFRNNVQSPAFNIGIKYDSIPKGYKADDIHMYMYNKKGQWMIVDASKTNADDLMCSALLKPSAYPYPFILMIDTLKPGITFLNTATVVEPSEDIIDTVIVNDNIANVKVRLFSGKGSDIPSLTSSDTANSSIDTMVLITSKDVVKDDEAYRAYVIISDGRAIDSIDISRKVHRTTSDLLNTDAEVWKSVATTSELDKTNISSALGALTNGKPWKYDSIQFRIFRWVETDKNKADSVKWVEYSDDENIRHLFDLVPGRVIWLKTRSAIPTINLGSGTTVSLKEPFYDTLKAKNWTDIALPYVFNVVIGDILDASAIGAAGDSIGFNSWVKDNNSKQSHVSPINIGIIQGPNYPDSELAPGQGLSYTIFNPTNHDIILKIPPIPSAMSKYKGLQKKSMTSGWSFALNAKTNNSTLTPMYCGYNPNGEGMTVYPCAPSFGNLHMGIVDQASNLVYGHMTMHGKQTNGYAYQVLLKNGSSEHQTFKLSISNKNNIPEQMQISIFNPDSKTFSSSPDAYMVEVGANENQYRWVIAGDQNFKAQWLAKFQVFDLALMKPYPNPCRGNLNIRYSIPYSVNGVTFNMFDQLGRKVWSFNAGNGLKPGLNVLSWNPSSSGKHLSAGTYILRLTASNGNGKLIGVKQTRFLYLP